MTRHALAATLLLALAGCGFHLRSAMHLPADLGPLQVVARNDRSPLPEALAEALTRSGAVSATVQTPESEAPATPAQVASLNLVTERWDSIPLSVDARGRAQEYTMRYAVIFNLRRADGSELVPQQAIELSRNYISVPTRSAGTESEQEILAKEMRRDMVASILRRIDAVVRMPAAVPPPAAQPSEAAPAIPVAPPAPATPQAPPATP